MNDEQRAREEERRRALSHHEQMLDAQSQCVPCKLCGDGAVITDAGIGAGYYIACANSKSFRDYSGCLINERRLSGWAYNVMDWWNRLHSDAALAETKPQGDVSEAADTIYVQFSDNGNIRKWDRKPFIGSTSYGKGERMPDVAILAAFEAGIEHERAAPCEVSRDDVANIVARAKWGSLNPGAGLPNDVPGGVDDYDRLAADAIFDLLSAAPTPPAKGGAEDDPRNA